MAVSSPSSVMAGGVIDLSASVSSLFLPPIRLFGDVLDKKWAYHSPVLTLLGLLLTLEGPNHGRSGFQALFH
jgi:hypothetical protein